MHQDVLERLQAIDTHAGAGFRGVMAPYDRHSARSIDLALFNYSWVSEKYGMYPTMDVRPASRAMALALHDSWPEGEQP